jgi:hypothetical protein
VKLDTDSSFDWHLPGAETPELFVLSRKKLLVFSCFIFLFPLNILSLFRRNIVG